MKKKFYYAGMLAAGLLTFASCNNDEDPIVGGGQTTPTEETSGTEIILQVANSGDGLTTRAGRPLYSSEAKQDIDAVKVFFIGEQNIVALEETFSDWMINSTDYTVDGHGKQQTWKLSADDMAKLTESSYRVYAVGYTSTESIYDYEDNYLTNYVDEPTSDAWKLFKAKVSDNELGEEIFAGEIAKLTIKDGEFDLSTNPKANVLTLHRQVSGLMGYFTNIPVFKLGGQSDLLSTMAEGQTSAETNAAEYKKITNSMQLRLVASNRSNTIMFAHFNSDFTSAEESDAMYVINGWQMSNDLIAKDAYFATAGDDAEPADGTPNAYSIYTINLKDWFPNGDVTGDGILGEADAAEGNGDNWVSPAENNQEIAGFKPGSVFAGNFIIPFEKVSGVNTLQLQLVGYDFTVEDAAGQKTLKAGTDLKVLRTWNINLQANDPQIGTVGNNAHMVTLDHVTGEPTGLTTGEEKANSYSLVRNHLYSVGEKGTDGYNPDTDIPEDLSKGLNLILRVNDNWEMIHKMEVE